MTDLSTNSQITEPLTLYCSIMSYSRQFTRFCFTINNPTPEQMDMLDRNLKPKAQYLIIGKETAPTTGTFHLQCFVIMKNKITITGVKNMIKVPSGAIQGCKGSDQQNVDYCQKGGNYEEFGQRPRTAGEAGGQAIIDKWDQVKEMAMSGLYKDYDSFAKAIMDQVPGGVHMFISQGKGLTNIFNMYKTVSNVTEIKAEWLMGPPGTGKSHTAREENDDHYVKAAGNKWFDGYNHESTVIIDDLDQHNVKELMPFIKNLVDKYALTVECKGSSMKIRPAKIVVTSNYHPSILFKEPTFLAAILRRFTIRKFNTVYVPASDDAVPMRLETAPEANGATLIDLSASPARTDVQPDAVLPPNAFW